MAQLRSYQSGITTVEILVAGFVVVLVVLAGVPAVMDFSRKQDMLGVHQNLYTALKMARVNAVVSGAPVTVCASFDGQSCSGSDWTKGWIVIQEGAKQGRSVLPRKVLWAYENMSDFAPSISKELSGEVQRVSFSEKGYSLSGERFTSLVCDDTDETSCFEMTVDRSGHILRSESFALRKSLAGQISTETFINADA